jgi:hypothetical protein
MNDRVIFIPEDFEAEVSILFSLADHPYDIASTSDGPTLGVVIPAELWERYENYKSLSESSTPTEPKKRGRPRKVQPDVSEEETDQ